MLEIDWSFLPNKENRTFKKLKGRTVLEKAMSYDLMQDAIEKGYGYLTGRHGKKDGSYRHITAFLTEFARQVGRNVLAGHYVHPMLVGQTAYKFDASGNIIDVFEIDEPEAQVKLIENTLQQLRARFPHCIKGQLPDLCLSSIKGHISKAVVMITRNKHPDCSYVRPTL